jgi:integration host factor subunit alpha
VLTSALIGEAPPENHAEIDAREEENDENDDFDSEDMDSEDMDGEGAEGGKY